MRRRIKVGILLSGTGSNFQVLANACKRKYYNAEIVCVGSNKSDAGGIQIAIDEGLPNFVVKQKTNKAIEEAINKHFTKHGVELICLAGYMKLLSADFIKKWNGKILNIHPSLLPAFKGMHAQRDALEYGVKLTGCTVHWIIPEMDAGPIIKQQACSVFEDDTVEELTRRILIGEHLIYQEVLNNVTKEMLEEFND